MRLIQMGMRAKGKVRKMEESDLDQVVEIEKATFSMPWSRESFRKACCAPENIYLVYEQHGIIMGYCGLWTVLGEGSITNMAVSSEYRQSHCGTQLMEKMEQFAKELEVNKFFLEVRENNTAARKLYHKMRYSDIGVRKNFYEKPVENAVIMSKICK